MYRSVLLGQLQGLISCWASLGSFVFGLRCKFMNSDLGAYSLWPTRCITETPWLDMLGRIHTVPFFFKLQALLVYKMAGKCPLQEGNTLGSPHLTASVYWKRNQLQLVAMEAKCMSSDLPFQTISDKTQLTQWVSDKKKKRNSMSALHKHNKSLNLKFTKLKLTPFLVMTWKNSIWHFFFFFLPWILISH